MLARMMEEESWMFTTGGKEAMGYLSLIVVIKYGLGGGFLSVSCVLTIRRLPEGGVCCRECPLYLC